jgi:DNA topoisomerase-1
MEHLRCVKCDDFYLLRDGAAGIFLAASQFPKHRETRAPTVEEIVSVKDQLDPKYKFLATAPLVDHEGRPSMVRFARKTKEQYVTSEVDGKTSGWRAHYQDGKWVEEIPPAKPAKKAAKAGSSKGGARKKAAARKSGARKKAAKKAAKKKAAKKKAAKA